MIRVLVVEDEMPILRSTCTMIERTNPEFKVTHRAANGKDALEILGNESIELLILDIQMPIMDGIQVLRKMREMKMDIPTVVLSGFQDFSYVREALRCGAIDYILKPLKIEDLKATLSKVEEIIWNQKSRQHVIETPSEVLSDMDGNYELALVILGAYRSNPEDDDERVEEKQCADFIENLLKQQLPQDCWWIIPGQYYNERLLVLRRLGNRSKQVLEQLVEESAINKAFHRPLTVVLSKSVFNHDSIYKGNQLLHQIAKDVMFLDRGQMCMDDTMEVKRHNKVKYDSIRPILLEVSHQEQVLPTIKKALESVNRRSVIMDLLKAGFWKYSEIFKGNYTYVELEEELVRILEDSYTKEMLYDRLEKLIITDFYNDTLNTRNKSKLAMQMKEYIEENYMHVINNNTLSEQYGYVPAHLRELFRKQYDVSPMEYLQNVRLDKSKQLLEGQSDLSLKEIAEAVGFNDSLYFSKVFRKLNGVSPSEYRKRRLESHD